MDEVKSESPLDLSIFLSESGYAVCCRKKEDAAELIRCLKASHPECATSWTPEYTHWDDYEEETCYTVDDMASTGFRRGYLGFTEKSWFVENGYKIVLFDDLIPGEELEESDLPIEFMFGR